MCMCVAGNSYEKRGKKHENVKEIKCDKERVERSYNFKIWDDWIICSYCFPLDNLYFFVPDSFLDVNAILCQTWNLHNALHILLFGKEKSSFCCTFPFGIHSSFCHPRGANLQSCKISLPLLETTRVPVSICINRATSWWGRFNKQATAKSQQQSHHF